MSETSGNCRIFDKQEIASAGFHPVAGPMKLESKPHSNSRLGPYLEGLSESQGCTVLILTFSSKSCPNCDQQLQSFERFLTGNYGLGSNVRLIEVNSEKGFKKIPQNKLDAMISLQDPHKKIFEEFSILETPSSILVNSDGEILGQFPSNVRFDTPQFEVFSHRIQKSSNDENALQFAVSSAFACFGVLGVILILRSILARWR